MQPAVLIQHLSQGLTTQSSQLYHCKGYRFRLDTVSNGLRIRVHRSDVPVGGWN